MLPELGIFMYAGPPLVIFVRARPLYINTALASPTRSTGNAGRSRGLEFMEGSKKRSSGHALQPQPRKVDHMLFSWLQPRLTPGDTILYSYTAFYDTGATLQF